jgi:hypothetical protein
LTLLKFRFASRTRVAIAAGINNSNGSSNETGDNGMSDDLTDSQIALLCDIGEYDLSKATAEQKRELERLLSEGYVEPAGSQSGSGFKLTAKAVGFLGERGAGLNES